MKHGRTSACSITSIVLCNNTELGGETYFMKNGTSTVLVKNVPPCCPYTYCTILALVTDCNTVTCYVHVPLVDQNGGDRASTRVSFLFQSEGIPRVYAVATVRKSSSTYFCHLQTSFYSGVAKLAAPRD